MTIAIGSTVKVKPPFDDAFPGEWVVTGLSETGAWQIGDGVDFDENNLIEVSDAHNQS